MVINFLDSEGNGSSVAFPPDKSALAPQFVSQYNTDFSAQTANAFEQTFENALADGGYSYGQMVLGIQLTAGPGQLIKIYNIRPLIIRRASIVTDTVIVEPAGAGPTHRIAYDLDSPNPVGKNEINDSIGQRYFGSQTIDVDSTNPQNLELDFHAEAASYVFNVAIDYDLGGRNYTQIVTGGNGQPLKLDVTGRLCDSPTNLSSDALAQFRKLRYRTIYTESTDLSGSTTLQPSDPTGFTTTENCD